MADGDTAAFFGDPPTWEYLREEIVPRIVEDAADRDAIRVWSIGCASGEDAYSLAIAFAEAVGEDEFRQRVKIYATDVDDDALAEGRHGTYPASRVENVPDDLLERYFEETDQRFIVRQELRRGVIFGRHDVVQDPPVSRIDLLTARNTAIHSTREAQERIAANFHFALRSGGYLFLAGSETMLARPDLFEPVELGRRAFLKVTLPAGEHPVTLPVAEHEPAHQNDELDMLRAALADEADRYRSLFESVPVALVTTDATGIIRHANAAAGQLLDIEPRFLLGTPLSLYADAHERAELRSLTRQLTATGGTSGDTRIRLRRRSGVALDLLVRATASLSEIRWVLQDVADEQQAEQRLWGLNRELEARVTEQAGEIEAVLEQLPVGVAIVDAETRAVRRMNARAQEIVGESLLRDAGDGLVALEPTNADGTPIDPGDLPARQALGGETTTRRTISVRVADGRRALLEVHATPIRGARGDVRAAVLTFDDVTERERREQADREFVSNAAHQLRTPLTAIASAVAALQTGAKNVPEERDRFLAHLERETDRLARLGRALLTLARAQRGESAPDIRVVRLRPLLEALAEWASRRAGVEIVVSCPANVGALANPELLEEALANVVANAVAHTDRGRVVLSAAAQDGTTIVEVADSGTGITPEEQPRVFERFYRASKSGPTGFGLGLPIAKAALEAMHGSIDIRSAVNEGTTIRICVPSARILR